MVRRVLLGLGVLCSVASAAPPPRDFTAETRAVYAVAACGDAPPPVFDAGTVRNHCRQVAHTVSLWKKQWRDRAMPWFETLLHAGYPSTVVYPFGGGDLVTLLGVYPDATEYTTLSLEGMGDPRPLAQLGSDQPRERALRATRLSAELARMRRQLTISLGWAWNTTNDLSAGSSSTGDGVPNILSLTLVALQAHGYEVVEARYFELAADGTPRYLTSAEVEAFDAEQTKAPRRHVVKDNTTVQPGLFNNIELVFRKRGEPNAPKKIFRHIGADLSDEGFAQSAAAYAYLDHRAGMAAMTKASSYLLWDPEFAKLRGLLLARMKLMISDDTGIPPRFAQPAGFTQKVFGAYRGAFFHFADKATAKEMVELWKAAPAGKLRFHFGYYDNRRNTHVLYTHR